MLDILYYALALFVLISGGYTLSRILIRLFKVGRIQRKIMQNKIHSRIISPAEQESFRTIYKKEIPGLKELKVYTVTGPLDCTGFSSQGREHFYFFAGGVRLHQGATTLVMDGMKLLETIASRNPDLPASPDNFEIVFPDNNTSKPGYLLKANSLQLAHCIS
ncbi:hypothetical protein [Salinispira pacifica]|uniref:Uncharacterized protein n=1 Tax=Salinispira pacifica TaxID=1307761 RepID=V5WK92_9SPIO|nr:hypothetical protein [Salinispira pacifica]AHC16237.1 hypothetical protein L21SP2_2889 [Salinispira pacifica]